MLRPRRADSEAALGQWAADREELNRLRWATLLYNLHDTNPDNGLVRDKIDAAVGGGERRAVPADALVAIHCNAASTEPTDDQSKHTRYGHGPAVGRGLRPHPSSCRRTGPGRSA
jgi:hypothetical protein